jgi:F-type H+-transporting ATPase subunit gamma
MAQLIQMRQQIKAIETIKKITHAMRLIARSSHARMRGNDAPLATYKNELMQLFLKLRNQIPTWQHPVLYPTATQNRTLIILISSQKGLCGPFNSALFNFFERTMTDQDIQKADYIAIGKKAVDYAKKRNLTVLTAHSTFNTRNRIAISHDIINNILTQSTPYTTVTVFSNLLKTFFLQRPHTYQLIPFPALEQPQPATFTEYVWEQNPTELLDTLALQTLQATLQALLFHSLLAEQAARFISMDTATRNAETLLDEKKRQYNKLRQTKITKELTELTASF